MFLLKFFVVASKNSVREKKLRTSLRDCFNSFSLTYVTRSLRGDYLFHLQDRLKRRDESFRKKKQVLSRKEEKEEEEMRRKK